MRETTALGAAIAAGLASGLWGSLDELKDVNSEGKTLFKPSIAIEEADKRFAKWEKAVQMSKGWAQD
jgi:glycerol kinase